MPFGGHFADIAAAAIPHESFWHECGLCDAEPSSAAVAASAKIRRAYVTLHLIPETLLTGFTAQSRLVATVSILHGTSMK